MYVEMALGTGVRGMWHTAIHIHDYIQRNLITLRDDQQQVSRLLSTTTVLQFFRYVTAPLSIWAW